MTAAQTSVGGQSRSCLAIRKQALRAASDTPGRAWPLAAVATAGAGVRPVLRTGEPSAGTDRAGDAYAYTRAIVRVRVRKLA